MNYFFFWAFLLTIVCWFITLFFWRRTLRDWAATIKLCETLIESLAALNLVEELNRATKEQQILPRYLTSKRKMDD